jgi:hypothetical protein
MEKVKEKAEALDLATVAENNGQPRPPLYQREVVTYLLAAHFLVDEDYIRLAVDLALDLGMDQDWFNYCYAKMEKVLGNRKDK